MTLVETVREKLLHAAAPLKLADVAKGLPKPRKVKANAFREQLRDAVEDEVRLGNAFRYPSGKNGEPRYWSRDERRLLREKVVELAGTPLERSKLTRALGKGLDGPFVEGVLRELIAEARLFEHPPKTKKGKARFGSSPPPPPLPALATKPHKAKVEKLAADCRKLLAAAGVEVEELLRTLRVHIGDETRPPPAVETPDELILKAVGTAPVVSLADLRREMPREFRGPAFDDAVLRLADQRRVVVSQDADPLSFSDAERAELVRDGEALYTTIASRR